MHIIVYILNITNQETFAFPSIASLFLHTHFFVPPARTLYPLASSNPNAIITNRTFLNQKTHIGTLIFFIESGHLIISLSTDQLYIEYRRFGLFSTITYSVATGQRHLLKDDTKSG